MGKIQEEEEEQVTKDILKRAEQAILYKGQRLASRKVYLEVQRQKEADKLKESDKPKELDKQKEDEGPKVGKSKDSHEEADKRSPTPEWDPQAVREAKRRGPSIQITISSKNESQIGRPKRG